MCLFVVPRASKLQLSHSHAAVFRGFFAGPRLRLGAKKLEVVEMFFVGHWEIRLGLALVLQLGGKFVIKKGRTRKISSKFAPPVSIQTIQLDSPNVFRRMPCNRPPASKLRGNTGMGSIPCSSHGPSYARTETWTQKLQFYLTFYDYKSA